MVKRIVLHAVPYIRESLRLENTQGSPQSEMPGSDSETRGGGRFCDGLDRNIVLFCWSHYYTYGRITAREYVDKLGNQVHPMIQTFPNNDAVFQDDNAPFTRLELFSHGLKSMKVNFNIYPDQHHHQIWASLNNFGQFWRLD
jgi:hypothetical protein